MVNMMNCHRLKVSVVLFFLVVLGVSGCGDSSDVGSVGKQAVLTPLKAGDVPDASDLPEAFSYALEQAMKGDSESMFQVGGAYIDERMPQINNPQKAFRWFQIAAERGHVAAQFNLGTFYFEGRGVGKDEPLGATWMLRAAQQGDRDAQFNVGLLYENGRGLEQDEAKALVWHLKAAEQGMALAQTSVGSMFRMGKGVREDPVTGARWYQRAADLGEPGAQYNLGIMYLVGEGVTQDLQKAYVWLSLSKPWFPDNAEKPLKELRRKLTKKQLAEAEKAIEDFNFKNPRYVIHKGEE